MSNRRQLVPRGLVQLEHLEDWGAVEAGRVCRKAVRQIFLVRMRISPIRSILPIVYSSYCRWGRTTHNTQWTDPSSFQMTVSKFSIVGKEKSEATRTA